MPSTPARQAATAWSPGLDDLERLPVDLDRAGDVSGVELVLRRQGDDRGRRGGPDLLDHRDVHDDAGVRPNP
jgi:hypothetical protein